MVGPSDQQLIRIVRHLARLHLEIERGVRDPEQLTNLMRPQAQFAWRRSRPRGAVLPSGPATDTDLGPVHLRRTADGEVFATVTTTTQPGRRGALTFALHIEGQHITIRQAQRVHPGLDYGRTPRPAIGQLTDRLDAALDERKTVLAALEATEGHTAEGRPLNLTPDADTWRKILGQLDTEITTLMRTDLVHHFDGQLRPPPAYRATGSRKSH